MGNVADENDNDDDCDDDDEEDDGDDNNVQGIGPCQPVRPTRDPQETGIDMFPTLCFILWGLYCIRHVQQKNIVYNVK